MKGTRGAVLNEIELWTRDFDKSPVYWLNGLAGTGKTTIAQTIAERAFADGRLGASFFCSRDFEDRSNLRLIFPTLAVQLARKYTEFRSVFVPLVQSDPGIAHESLYNQMDKLIVRPLTESSVSTMIVIDALDECKDEETTSAILSVLGRSISKVSKVKFFLTGRPEPRIQTGFRLPLLRQDTDVFVLHDVEPNSITSDVRLFFKHSFLEIANGRGGLDGWPTNEEIERLCERAAGLFVYAVATVKFIDKRGTNPRKQLNLLLQSPENSAREAKTKFKTNISLDSLYTSILQDAFGDDDDPDNDPKVRSVLGAVLLAANPLSPSTIATLLDFDIEDVFPLLSSAQSLLILQDVDCPVRPFHKSFPDFLIDPGRCLDQRFHVSPPHHHSQLLINCLELMERTLEKNMCKLPDGVANSDVNDLKERTRRYIDPALRYACRSWHTHLVRGYPKSVNTDETDSALRRFLERKFLFWLEVLSVLGAVRNAVDALQVTADWLEVCQYWLVFSPKSLSELIQESPTLELVNECSRFVTRHFKIISTSSPHIYHSALVLTPRQSIVQKLYKSHAQPFVRVVHGMPVLWDSSAAVSTFRSKIQPAVWSPCSRLIAIGSSNTKRVDMLDSATLQRLQSFEFSREVPSRPEALAFSPDSRMLTAVICHDIPNTGGLVVSWDLQTGGVVSAIERKGYHDTKVGNTHITYSMNGRMVAALSRYESSTTISIYDVASGVYMHDVCHGARTSQDPALGPPHVYKIWTHGESLRFATPRPAGIAIWEVGFAPYSTPAEIESLSTPDNAVKTCFFKPKGKTDIAGTEFHPASSRLAFVCAETEGTFILRVWDTRASKLLLHHRDIGPSHQMTFSSDGRFFACITDGSGVYLWKESTTGYTLLEKLVPDSRNPEPSLSPSGGSIMIITFDSTSTIHLWHTKSFTPSTSNALAQTVHHSIQNFLLEFLPDRPLAVITRKKEKVLTVLDLESGVPQLTIDTSAEVYGFRPIKNTVVVIGDEKVICWDLPAGTFLPDASMNVGDSTQTITFGKVKDSIVVAASISFDFRYVALIRHNLAGRRHNFLDVRCTSTGRTIREEIWVCAVWFTPGERDIWCAAKNEAKVFTITPDALDYVGTIAGFEYGSWGCPWGSSHGYKITDEGWILCRDGKRLLMLPPLWQSHFREEQVWNGKFLALLHGELPEVVILELEP